MDYSQDLIKTVTRVARELASVPRERAAQRPAPGKWSVQEIIGHLVDSASNNHQRFVRARWQDDLVFPTYDQDAWVAAQSYAASDWPELIDLWRSFNLHIAHVMEATPENVRLRAHRRHNFDRIGWQPFAADEPGTLDWLMRDYVEHLHHHLRQVEGILRRRD